MDIKACRTATINATKWLLSQQNTDGSMRPVELGVATYHRVPFALAVMGQSERAARLCGWISANALDEDGDLTLVYPRQGLHKRFYPIANAWVIMGAQITGNFRISAPSLGFLTSLQHPQSGGFIQGGPDAGLDSEQDAMTTATAGLACLYGGQFDAAQRAGDYLVGLLEAQPANAARLAFVTRKGAEVVRDYPEEMVESYAITVGKTEQWYHVPGLAAGFLARLSESTGDDLYLAAAGQYLTMADSCGNDRYTFDTSPLFGWGAAVLHSVSGNTNFRRIAGAVADGMLELQLANGSWLKGSMGEDEESDVVDATAEGIIALTAILQAMASGE
jgi:hypothetical protein